MKQSAKIIEKTNGQLVYERRLIADRKSQSMNPPDNDDADYVDYLSKEICLPDVGKIYMVGSNEYVGPNSLKDHLCSIYFSDDNGEGFGGNSNGNIKRYHGWRGTTDDWSFSGLGVRKCLSATISGDRSKVVRIVFGKDLKLMEL